MQSVNGLEVELVGEGPTVLCLHSLLSEKSSFAPLAERLSGERRLALVNLPGFGASRGRAASVEEFADAVAACCDELALPDYTDVVGNGLGGFVALALAANYGARFGRIALVGSAVAFPEGGRATFRALAAKADAEGMAPLADAAMQRMFPAEFIATNLELIADRKNVFRSIDPQVFAAAARALAGLDFGPALPRVANPVLVMAGETDGATPPALGRELAARIAGARFVELSGLGHCPHIQNPGAFVAAISDFLGLEARAG